MFRRRECVDVDGRGECSCKTRICAKSFGKPLVGHTTSELLLLMSVSVCFIFGFGGGEFLHPPPLLDLAHSIEY